MGLAASCPQLLFDLDKSKLTIVPIYLIKKKEKKKRKIKKRKLEAVLYFCTSDPAGTFPILPYLGECISPGVSYTMLKLSPFLVEVGTFFLTE